MDLPTKVYIEHGLKKMPKAKPLATLLVEEAVRQRATLGEFKLAVEIATTILKEQMNPDMLFIDGYEGDVEAIIKSL